MDNTSEFIENFLEHADYDPAARRAYYLRTRKLKGRKPSSGQKVVSLRKRVEEDEVPMTSRSGAKLVEYDGKGLGRATYADGSTFDGAGWKTSSSGGRKQVIKTKIARARAAAAKIQNPRVRQQAMIKLNAMERRLKSTGTTNRGRGV